VFLIIKILVLLPVLIISRAAANTLELPPTGNIGITVGIGAGGSYDSVARLLARFMPKNIPGNPGVVVKNLPGAGSIRAAEYLYKIAPKDGSELGFFLPTVFLETKIKPEFGIKPELFEYIGRVGSVLTVGAVWHSSSINSVYDSKKKSIPLAGTFPGASSITVPILMNKILGTNFKIVSGYKGSAEILNALEIGEVEGIGATTYSFLSSRGLIAAGKIRLLYSVNVERHPAISEVPLLSDFSSNEDDRKVLNLVSSSSFIGKTLVAPPGIDPLKTRTLQAAFDRSMQDTELKNILAKMEEENDSLRGEDMKKIVSEILSVSPAVLIRYKELTDLN
jgi:tripartite-type tricarboxylate transporter receptor subunit TctC